MSMLARYKKSGGMMELVRLIESSPEPKRTQLLNMVRNEDKAFALSVESKLFTYDQFKAQAESVIAEVVLATPPKFVAIAMSKETEDFVKLVEKCLGKNFQEYKMERENFASTPPSDSQLQTAQRKFLTEARKLEKDGKIRLSQPEATEENVGVITTAPNLSPVTAAGMSAATKSKETAPLTSGAKAEEGCPTIASFNLEPPLAGLHGERFEIFVKKLLGF